jgi:N-succinyldiaminopimelate aminotransferase
MVTRTPALVERMRPYAQSIFGQMSALASRTGAINLGQGFPDEDGPVELQRIAMAAIADGRGNQYPPAHGLLELREAVAEHQSRFYGLSLDPHTDVVIATGASEVLQSALLALCEPGDEVIVFEPWFDLYAAGIALAGATRVSVPLQPPSYRPDIDALRDAISPRTRMLLLNTPHNPTGVVFTRAELDAIAELAIEHDLIVLSDEAYEHLWFDGHPHIPISTIPGMFERTISVGSGGKSFSFTGWKVGWGSGPTDLIAAVRTVRQHLSYVSSGPFQFAIAAGLGLPDEYFDDLRASMQAKRDLLTTGLRSLGFNVSESQGTYFATSDLGPFERIDGRSMDGRQLCEWMPEHIGVAAIPVQVFCDDPNLGSHSLRWAFGKHDDTITEALKRVERAVQS